jgi:hypothetical protein
MLRHAADGLRRSEPLTDEDGSADPGCSPETTEIGPWVCVVPNTQTEEDPSAEDPSAYTGACRLHHQCYGVPSSFEAYWEATISYGVNYRTGFYEIGKIHARVDWETYYGLTHAKMTFRPTRTTHNTIFTATMFNGAPNARHGGSVIRHSDDESDLFSYVWPNRDLTWDYFHYNHTMWDKNTATQFNWSAPGYRGLYYFYVRSPSSHTNRLGPLARYAFREPRDGGLPQDAYGYGWKR